MLEIMPKTVILKDRQESSEFNDLRILWKCHDFCIIQILREINLEDSRNAKSAILTHFKALNFDFYEFLHFLKAEIYLTNKNQSP